MITYTYDVIDLYLDSFFYLNNILFNKFEWDFAAVTVYFNLLSTLKPNENIECLQLGVLKRCGKKLRRGTKCLVTGLEKNYMFSHEYLDRAFCYCNKSI